MITHTTNKITDGTITGSDIGNNQVIKKINGITDSLNLVAGSNVTITPSDNSMIISSASGPGGTITGITAGNGLTGGGTSGNVTLTVNNAGISNEMIQNNAVTSDKIFDGAIVSTDISNSSITSEKIVDNTISASDLANDQVVKSINSIRDSIEIVGLGLVSVHKDENTITIYGELGPSGPYIQNRIAKFSGSQLGFTNMFHTQEGNIGINTETPTGILDVQGGTSVSDSGRGINLIAENGSKGGKVILQGGNPSGGVFLKGGPESSGGVFLEAGWGGGINICSGTSYWGGGDINILSSVPLIPNSNNIAGYRHPPLAGNINIKTAYANDNGGNITISTGSATEGWGGSISMSTGSSRGDNDFIISTGMNNYGFGAFDLHCGGGFVDLKSTGGFDTLKLGSALAGMNIANDIIITPGTGGLVKVNGSGTYTGTWTQASDERYKKNVMPINNSLQKIQQLNGVTYEFRKEEFPEKNFDYGKQIGLIAQDVEKVLPELVKTDSEGYKSVAYQNMVAVLVEAVKEQQEVINELKKEVSELKRIFNKEMSSK